MAKRIDEGKGRQKYSCNTHRKQVNLNGCLDTLIAGDCDARFLPFNVSVGVGSDRRLILRQSALLLLTLQMVSAASEFPGCSEAILHEVPFDQSLVH